MSNNDHCFKLISSSSLVSLSEPVSNITKMKVKGLRYTTASLGNEIMTIDITGFSNTKYVDGSGKTYKCTKVIYLPAYDDTFCHYVNESQTNYFDAINKEPIRSLASFQINILINGAFSSDISSTNPLYLELYCE